MLHINQGGHYSTCSSQSMLTTCDAADQHRCRGCRRTPVQADAPVCDDNLLTRVPLHRQTPAQHSKTFASHGLVKASALTTQLSLRCLPLQNQSTPWACEKHWVFAVPLGSQLPPSAKPKHPMGLYKHRLVAQLKSQLPSCAKIMVCSDQSREKDARKPPSCPHTLP